MKEKLLSNSLIENAAEKFKQGFKNGSHEVSYWTKKLENIVASEIKGANLSKQDAELMSFNLKNEFYFLVMKSLDVTKNKDFFKYLLGVTTNDGIEDVKVSSYLFSEYDFIFELDDEVIPFLKDDKEAIKFLVGTTEYFDSDKQYKKYFEFLIKHKDIVISELPNQAVHIEKEYDFYANNKLSKIRIKGIVGLYDGVIDNIETHIFKSVLRQSFSELMYGNSEVVNQFSKEINIIKKLIPTTTKMSVDEFSKWFNNLKKEFKKKVPKMYKEESVIECLEVFESVLGK